VPVRQRTRSPWWVALGCAVVVVVLTVLQLLRQAGIPSWQTIWAEDGAVFLQGAENLRSTFTSYAGYEHLVPRLIALGSVPVPSTQLARYFAVAGALTTSLLSVSMYVLSRDLVPARILRAVLVLAVAFVPAAVGENLASGAYVNWAFVFVCFWALLFVPRTRREVALAGSIVFLAASSNILVLLFVPLAGVLAVKRRDRKSRLVIGAYAVGVALQGTVAILASTSSQIGKSKASELPLLYAVRVLASALVGDKWTRSLWLDLGTGVAVCATVAIVGLVVFLTCRTIGTRRWLGLIAVGYSVLFFCYPVYVRGSLALHLTKDSFSFAGARFATLSIQLLLSGILILLSGARMGTTAKRAAIAVVVVQFALLAVVGFRAANPRSAGPEWKQALAGSRLACAAHPKHLVPVAISPWGWGVQLSCSRIDR